MLKHSEQQDDGGFFHYVVFGNCAPWDAPDSACVKCANEDEADKLMALLNHSSEATDEMIDAACADVPDMFRVDAARAIEAALAVILNGD